MNARVFVAIAACGLLVTAGCGRDSAAGAAPASRPGEHPLSRGSGAPSACALLHPRADFVRRVNAIAAIDGADQVADSVGLVMSDLAARRTVGDTVSRDCVPEFLAILDDVAADRLERAGTAGVWSQGLTRAIRARRLAPMLLVPRAFDWLRLTTERRLWVVLTLANAARPEADEALLRIALLELAALPTAFSDTVIVPVGRAASAGWGLSIDTYVFVESVHRLALHDNGAALREIARRGRSPIALRRYVENVLRDACVSANLSTGREPMTNCY